MLSIYTTVLSSLSYHFNIVCLFYLWSFLIFQKKSMVSRIFSFKCLQVSSPDYLKKTIPNTWQINLCVCVHVFYLLVKIIKHLIDFPIHWFMWKRKYVTHCTKLKLIKQPNFLHDFPTMTNVLVHMFWFSHRYRLLSSF